MRWVAFALLLLFLPTCTNAWGPATHDRICREVVSEVWGREGLDCLSNIGSEYCGDLRTACGEKAYASCTQFYSCIQSYSGGNTIDPATYAEFVLKDLEDHYDYSSCPIKTFRDNEWICERSDNPSKEKIDHWMKYAEDADTLCARIARFCTASNYYADSKFQPYQVSHLVGCLGRTLADEVDDKISSGEEDWILKKQCTFSYMRELAGMKKETRSHVTFIVKLGDIEDIISDLKGKARELASRGYSEVEGSISVSLVGVEVAGSHAASNGETAVNKGEGSTTTLMAPPLEELGDMEDDLASIWEDMSGIMNHFSKERSQEARSKLKNMMLVFIAGMVTACLIFLAYVIARVQARNQKEPERPPQPREPDKPPGTKKQPVKEKAAPMEAGKPTETPKKTVKTPAARRGPGRPRRKTPPVMRTKTKTTKKGGR